LNLAVNQNSERFPEDFMFQLNRFEYERIRQQVEALQKNPASKIVIIDTLRQNPTDLYLPYAFTVQGVAMLSSVLSSTAAINMNIAIVRAFGGIRSVLLKQKDVKEQIRGIKEQLGEQDAELTQIYDAIENMVDEKASQRKWGERKRIGFKKE
jgi:ORF6N domain